MIKSKAGRAIAIICLFCILPFISQAQTINGASYIQLNSPITADIKQELKQQAIDSLSRSLEIWIKNFFDKDFDNTNSVTMHFLNKFARLCSQNAKETSNINERTYSVELALPDHLVDSLLSSYNREYDSLAIHYWKISQQSITQENKIGLFRAGTYALFYSLAHIGTPVILPETSPKTLLVSHSRATLQQLIEKLDISFDNPIVHGQPPNPIQKEVRISVTLDSVPYPDFPLVASLPDGRVIYSTKTDSKGEATFANLKVPFVAHGTFLHLRPNFPGIVDPSLSFDVTSLGLKLSPGCDQTLIFNIIRPTFTLEYSATSVNQLDIPADFANPTLVQQFLRDSCSMQPHSGGQKPDLSVLIRCQASFYSYDEREQSQLKAEAQIVISETKPNGSVVEKTAVLNDKYYDIRLKLPSSDNKRKKRKKYSSEENEIPKGKFFWESYDALKSLLKEALSEL